MNRLEDQWHQLKTHEIVGQMFEDEYDDWNSPDEDRSFSDLDSAHLMPKSVVVDQSFDWEDDTLLRTPWHETIIYETHVKGFTKLHAD